MIEIFIIVVILIFYFFMKKTKNAYETAYDLGINYLDTITLVPNYAVMFDIDDTLIHNDKPIKPIIKLLGECNKRNLQVIIITARDSIYTEETIQDLLDNFIYPNPDNFIEVYKKFQIDFIPKNAVFYDYIYLRNSPKDDNNFFKSKVKGQFAKNNLYTIMSIGDSEIDVIGNYSGYSIKLPSILHNDPRLFHKNNLGQMVHVKI